MSDLDTSGKESDFQPSIPTEPQRTQRRLSAHQRFLRYKASKGMVGVGELDSLESTELGDLQLGGSGVGASGAAGSLGRPSQMPSGSGGSGATAVDDRGSSVLASVNEGVAVSAYPPPTTATPGPPRRKKTHLACDTTPSPIPPYFQTKSLQHFHPIRSSLLQDLTAPPISTLNTRRSNTANKSSVADFSAFNTADPLTASPTNTMNHSIPAAAGSDHTAVPFPVDSLARPNRKERTVSLAIGHAQQQQLLLQQQQQEQHHARLSGGEYTRGVAAVAADPPNSSANSFVESIASSGGRGAPTISSEHQRQQFYSQQQQQQQQHHHQNNVSYDYQQQYTFPPQQDYTFPPQQNKSYAESTLSEESGQQSIRSDDRQPHTLHGVGEASPVNRFGPSLSFNKSFSSSKKGNNSVPPNPAAAVSAATNLGFFAGGGMKKEKKKKSITEEVVDVSFGPPKKLNLQRRKSEGPNVAKSSMESNTSTPKGSLEKKGVVGASDSDESGTTGGVAAGGKGGMFSKLARTLSKKHNRGGSPNSLDVVQMPAAPLPFSSGGGSRASAESFTETPDHMKQAFLRPTPGPPTVVPVPVAASRNADGANVHPSLAVAAQIAFEQPSATTAMATGLRRAKSFSGTTASARSGGGGESGEDGGEDSKLARFRARRAAEKARLLAEKAE
ncbi:hypothetical protein BDR26DRAFT_893542 [Obelidium mucronatum]|nr:hypothetical protein BDR26DRAFT_893542 [Obelidium mucronatum]